MLKHPSEKVNNIALVSVLQKNRNNGIRMYV